jgi:hypothetical protein
MVIYPFPEKMMLTEAIKKDQEKPRFDLLDPEFLEGVADVLAFGAEKYSDHNWKLGFKWSRLIAATGRHLLAIMRREDIDPESGKPHVYHLGCSVMFLAWHMKHRRDLDDRYTTVAVEKEPCGKYCGPDEVKNTSVDYCTTIYDKDYTENARYKHNERWKVVQLDGPAPNVHCQFSEKAHKSWFR